jgi:hypothetical protein
VLVQNNTFESAGVKSSRLQGLDAEHDISGVTFENLTIGGQKCLSAEDAGLDIRPFVGGVIFR